MVQATWRPAVFKPAPPAPLTAATDTAARLVLIGLALYLLMSDNLLVSLGYPYDVPYGPFPAKIHPGTYFILFGFLRLLADGNPIRRLVTLGRMEPAAIVFLGAPLIVLMISVARFGTSGTAFLIDTFLSAAMIVLVLRAAGDDWIRLAFRLVVALVLVNAMIGCLQPFGQWRLVPYLVGDEPLKEELFRSNALAGHPLTNASRTALIALALPALFGRLRLALLLGLLVMALLAFGGRTALVVTLALLSGWGGVTLIRGIVSKSFQRTAVIMLAIGAPVVLAAMLAVVLGSDIGARIFNTFYWDDSAQARLLVFKVFDYVQSRNLILGISPEDIERLLFYLRSTTTLYYIENVWILLLLQFGVVGFLLLVPPMLGTVLTIAARGGTPARLVALAFLVLTSSNNSLAAKTQELALLMPILLGSACYRPAASRRLTATAAAAAARPTTAATPQSLVPPAWRPKARVEKAEIT